MRLVVVVEYDSKYPSYPLGHVGEFTHFGCNNKYKDVMCVSSKTHLNYGFSVLTGKMNLSDSKTRVVELSCPAMKILFGVK